MKNLNTKKLAYAALFLALCLVLPMLTGQIPQIGSMLLPMHIPVLLCGLVCGWMKKELGITVSGGLCCAAAALGPVRDASDVSGGYCDGL